MKWYRNPVQMLFGNTIGLLLLLAYTSFLNNASVLSLVGIFATSFVWSGLSKRKQYIQGMFPALVCTSILQLGYFISGKDIYPTSISIPLFILNIVIVAVISFTASWIGKTIGNKIRGNKEEEEQRQEAIRSQFSEQIKRITAIVLIMYIHGFILVPFASKVFASEKQTSDEFIQNYDPEKQYKVSSQWVYEPPKERMPKEGAVNIDSTKAFDNLTPEQITEIETKCQISGCSSKEELEKANNEQKKNLEEEQRINKLEFTNPEQAKLEKLKNKHLTIDQILKLQKNGKINSKVAFALVANGIKTGKISAWDAFWKGRKAIQEFVKNNPEAQKVISDFMQHPTDLGEQYRLLALADKYIGGPFHGTKEFVDAAIVEPGNAFLKFAKEHPKEAILSGLFVVGATVVCIAFPAVGIAAAGLGIAFTGFNLTSAYIHGGKDAVIHQVFSDKTINMALSGDIWGAAGRGIVELGGLILSNIPDSPGRYIEAAGVIGAVIRFKRGATIISDVRDGLVLLKQSGRVTAESVKVGGELFKIALSNGDEATKLLGNYLFHNNDYALLGAITKNIDEVEKIGGLESRQAALKKEFDGLMKMIEGKEPIKGETIVHIQDRPTAKGSKTVVRHLNGNAKVEIPSFTNETHWVHSTAGEFKDGVFQGGHSKGSLPQGTTVRETSTRTAQGVYEADVTVTYNGIAQTRPKTMFPDHWDEPKIKEEVEFAFEKREIVPVDKPNGRTEVIYRGKSKSGVIIEFHIDNVDGSYNFFPIYE